MSTLGELYRVSQYTWELSDDFLYRLRYLRHFIINTINIEVFQFKDLISKTPGLEILKVWCTFFVIFKIDGNLAKSESFYLIKRPLFQNLVRRS